MFDYYEKSRSFVIHIDFLILGKCFLSLDNQERMKEAKSLAVKKLKEIMWESKKGKMFLTTSRISWSGSLIMRADQRTGKKWIKRHEDNTAFSMRFMLYTDRYIHKCATPRAPAECSELMCKCKWFNFQRLNSFSAVSTHTVTQVLLKLYPKPML